MSSPMQGQFFQSNSSIGSPSLSPIPVSPETKKKPTFKVLTPQEAAVNKQAILKLSQEIGVLKSSKVRNLIGLIQEKELNLSLAKLANIESCYQNLKDKSLLESQTAFQRKADLEKNIDILSSELNKERDNVTSLQKQLSLTKTTLNDNAKQFDADLRIADRKAKKIQSEIQKKLDEVTTQRDNLSKQNHALQKLIDTITTKCKDLSEELANQKMTNGNLIREKENLSKELTQKKEESIKLAKKLEDQQQKYTGLEQERAGFQSMFIHLKEENHRLQNEVKLQKEEKEHLQTQLDSAKGIIQNISNDNVQLQKQLNAAISKKDESEKQIRDLKRKFAETFSGIEAIAKKAKDSVN